MIRRLWSGLSQETRFFLVIAGWAGALGIVYWIVSQEAAGTALLAGLALATGAMTVWLARGERRRTAGRRAGRGAVVGPDAGPAEPDRSAAGTAGVDRPFLDEDGPIPDATLAPFALGLGIALAAIGPVFGLAPVAVGAVSLAWGAWAWLGAARDELDALDGADPPAATGVVAGHDERRR